MAFIIFYVINPAELLYAGFITSFIIQCRTKYITFMHVRKGRPEEQHLEKEAESS